MAYNLMLLKEFSLKTMVLHEIAKICWGDFISTYPNNEETEQKLLIAYRKRALNKIYKLSSNLPKTIIQELVRAVLNLQRGYSEALVCAEMHKSRNKLVLLNPLWAGAYSAKNFIDPNGYFNELIWAKRFVSDESKPVFSRFELACFYCLEDAVVALWSSMNKDGERLPYDVAFSNIWRKCNYLVALWVHRLDNRLDHLMRVNYNFRPGFYACGFKYAKLYGAEYATRFFWDGCTDAEKTTWFTEMDDDPMDDDDLLNMAFKNQAGCVNFIYSLLPEEHKISLVLHHNRVQRTNENFIWTCLLSSRFYETALNDILSIPLPFSDYTLTLLLQRMTLKMRELPITEYKYVFESLWGSFSQSKRENILDRESNMIHNLIEIKDIDLLETIIRPHSAIEKKRMLLDDWQFAGISALDRFSNKGDYDALLQYLLLFLMDRDPDTQKLSMRRDALNLLDRFLDEKAFNDWIRGQIPEYELRGVNKVIDNLKGSLLVLNSILEKVERNALP